MEVLEPTPPTPTEAFHLQFDKSDAQKHYEENNNAKWCLFAMLVGLTALEDGRALGDTEIFPYKDMKLSKLLVPTNAHYAAEVNRRCIQLGMEEQTCGYWKKDRLIAFLKDHPIVSIPDKEFLLHEELKVYDLLVAAEKDKEKQGNWGDNHPWLRLYCCLYDDKTREYFLAKDDVMDRQELDARNSDSRPPTLYEKVCELYNDPDVVYELPPNPHLHHAFANSIVLKFEDMPGELTPEEAKRRLGEARAKLMKVISRWELSGNGFGQRAPEDSDFGVIGDNEEEFEDGDNRARFLDGIGGEHLLIGWDLSNLHGLLGNFLNKFSSAAAVDCDNINTDTSDVQNRRRLTEDQRDARQFRNSISASMQTMSVASLYQQLRETEDKIVTLTRYTWEATTTEATDFYEDCLKLEKERRKELQEELDRIRRPRTE